MDDLFGVTELVKEKVAGDEEAHHRPMEIHETNAPSPKSGASNNGLADVTHVENEDKSTR
jgi:hypothetical protein